MARYTLYVLEYGKIYAIYLGIWQDIRCLSCVNWEIYSEIRCCMRDLLERDLLLHVRTSVAYCQTSRN